jgi:hypothetical protein
MKLLLFCLLSLFIITSCTSEYNERLENAIHLKKEFNIILLNVNISNKDILLQELTNQIKFQAQISGNEIKFYKDLENRFNQ